MNKNERDMIFNSFNYLINRIFLSILHYVGGNPRHKKKKKKNMSSFYNGNVYNVEF
jgi:hypothetical protein